MHNDFRKLDALIPQFEVLYDTGKLTLQKIIEYQTELDRIARDYPYDEVLGSQCFKLYELQALIYKASNKDELALDCLKHGISKMNSADVFLSRSARAWADYRTLVFSKVRQNLKSEAFKEIAIGIAIALGALIFMVVLYALSESSAKEEAIANGQPEYSFHYLIAWGPVIFGAGMAFRGLHKLFNLSEESVQVAEGIA